MISKVQEVFLPAVVVDLDDQPVAAVQGDHYSGGWKSVAAAVEVEAGRPTLEQKITKIG